MLFLSLFISAFGEEDSSGNELRSNRKTGVNQMHIAYLGEQERSVSWTSLTEKYPITLLYQLAVPGPEGKIKRVDSTVKTFIEPQDKSQERYIHTVFLSNLTYGPYNYAPEGNEWYNFNVHENTADDEQTFLIYGDLGVENSQCLDAIENLVGTLADDLDMIWHIGDFAYDMCDNNGQNTDLFMNMVEPIASALPYMTIPGNHESHFNFTHYESRYSSVSKTNPFYYSYDYGNVHVIHFTTELYYYPDQFSEQNIKDQYEWIQQDLKTASKNRKQHPWIITTGHRPMYCERLSSKCVNDTDPVRVGPYGLEKMFNDYGVDVAFWGHVHLYERMFPLNNEEYEIQPLDKYGNPKWVTHVITGAPGNKEDVSTNMKDQPDWSAVRLEEYSFTTLTAAREYLTIKQWSKDVIPKIIDQFHITKTKQSNTLRWYERAIKWLQGVSKMIF